MLKKLRVYLLSLQPFELILDNEALQYTFKKKDVYECLERWMDFLAEYEFEKKCESGVRRFTVDFLSRYSKQKGAPDKAEDD